MSIMTGNFPKALVGGTTKQKKMPKKQAPVPNLGKMFMKKQSRGR